MSAKEANRRVIILISGPHGTGKTTIARALARRFKMRYISAGEIFRKKARELGFDIIEFTKYVEKHPEVDYEIDDQIKNELQKGNAVLDSQLAYFMVDALKPIKILVIAEKEDRIRRLMQRENISYEEAKREIEVRDAEERKRFKRLYNVNLWNPKDFHIIVNTSKLSKDETVKIVVHACKILIKNWKW